MSKPVIVIALMIGAVITFREDIGVVLERAAGMSTSPDMAVRSASTAERTVILYATPTCGYCKKARRFFEENGIAYSERNVNASMAASKEMRALGGGGVPTILIDGEQVIHGWNERALRESLL
ncbi:MAG: glutaredoxin family protein [Gammaproteobacteria bacterium]|nr:glutaredoxin family protein [Gammaproteobacteria bacterium]MBQ0774678.1 glutaredoxin family protein [Gammaproteobacteria bacterium]